MIAKYKIRTKLSQPNCVAYARVCERHLGIINTLLSVDYWLPLCYFAINTWSITSSYYLFYRKLIANFCPHWFVVLLILHWSSKASVQNKQFLIKLIAVFLPNVSNNILWIRFHHLQYNWLMYGSLKIWVYHCLSVSEFQIFVKSCSIASRNTPSLKKWCMINIQFKDLLTYVWLAQLNKH